MEKKPSIRNSLLSFLFLFLASSAVAGKVERTREAITKYPQISILMNVDVDRDRDSKSRPLYSVGGDRLGYQKDVVEFIILEIKVRNLGIKPLEDLSLECHIYGVQRAEKGNIKKSGDVFLAHDETIEIKLLKRGEERDFETGSVLFARRTDYGRFSNYQGVFHFGKKYHGYKVNLLYKGTPILVATHR